MTIDYFLLFLLQNELSNEIEAIKAQNVQEMSEMKATLVNQHMGKFQVRITVVRHFLMIPKKEKK